MVARIRSEIVPLCQGAGPRASVAKRRKTTDSSSDAKRSTGTSFRAPERIVIGINAATRLLEHSECSGGGGCESSGAYKGVTGGARCTLQVVVACHDPRSPLLVEHLVALARARRVPLLLLPGAASKLGELFGGCRTVSALVIVGRRGAADTTAAASAAVATELDEEQLELGAERAKDGSEEVAQRAQRGSSPAGAAAAESEAVARRLDARIDSIAEFLAAKAKVNLG